MLPGPEPRKNAAGAGGVSAENSFGRIYTPKELAETQPNYCELWSEKATILGSVRPIAEEYGLTVRPCHGYGSCGMEMEVGDLFQEIGKPITVFYLGDTDPSGEQMEEDIHRRVEAASGVEFEMVRLAIHAADIKKFNLPPQKIKSTDSRAPAFRRKYGKNAATVELDALPVDELRARIVDAVGELIDFDDWNRQRLVEGAEVKSILRVAETFKNLPQLDRGGH